MTAQANVYAQALYTLAKEENCADGILEELAALSEAFGKEPEYLRLLAAPNLSKQERCGILDGAFRGKVHQYVLNFLKILTERGYIRLFPECCRCYRESYNRDRGILEVRAVTAVALKPQQRDRLKEKLESVTGKQICLLEQVDPGCLGGVRLDYDGKRLDDTVSHRLEAIGAMLKNTVL